MLYNGRRGDMMDFAYKMRCMVFDEWTKNKSNVSDLCRKYDFSRKWFYKFKKRFLTMGFEGLKDKPRETPSMPHAIDYSIKTAILDHVYDYPTHGPRRIHMELQRRSVRVSEGAIYNFLLKENLSTKRKRLFWAESQGKNILTHKQKAYIDAQNRHVESNSPGELVGIDTFMVCIKGLGKLWQYTACDTFSSFGWAKLYTRKTTDETVDFLENHLLKRLPPGRIKRILTDQGTEFYSARHRKYTYWLERIYKDYNLVHTITKPAHPWTNGYAERLNRTIWDEFYLCRLSRGFENIDEVQKELDIFMREYNFKRIHTGYKLKNQNYQYPYQAFFDIKEASNISQLQTGLI